VSATDALNLAIQADLPTFMEESLRYPSAIWSRFLFFIFIVGPGKMGLHFNIKSHVTIQLIFLTSIMDRFFSRWD
jgi:hypothetical protein